MLGAPAMKLVSRLTIALVIGMCLVLATYGAISVRRERVLFEISDKIRRTTDMETILTTTVSELTRAVGASSARIRLGTFPSGIEKKSSADNV